MKIRRLDQATPFCPCNNRLMARFWGVSGQALSVVQACLQKRSPSFWWESFLAVIQRSTLNNLKQRLIHTADDNWWWMMTRRRRAESPPPTTTIGAVNDDDSFRWWRSLAKQQQKWLWWYWTWWHWILILNTDVLPPSNDALRCWFDLCIWVHMVGLVCREHALLPPCDI